ncbi:MAG TPA: hypothetical protein VK881_11550 [bacterium]|nr:hypothetical protein [bacterium]
MGKIGLAVAIVAAAAMVSAPTDAAPALAPAFTLERLDGGHLSLSNFKGAPIVLLFWAPW